MERGPMSGRALTADQTGGPAGKGACADGKHLLCASRLLTQPAEDYLVLHQRLLAASAGDVEDVELLGVGERCVRCYAQPHKVMHGISRLRVDAVGRIRDAGEHFEGAGQVVQAWPQWR